MSSKRAISAALALSLALAAGSAHAELCMLGKNVQVLWKGEWYPASVKKNETTRCYVSYKGFSSDDDEWVGPERLKIKVLWKGDWYNAKQVEDGDQGGNHARTHRRTSGSEAPPFNDPI
mgnify:CR=1 FL=1